MAKYIIDVPDEKIYAYVNEDKTFLRVPISAGENNIKSVFAPTMLRITPYTEPDEQSVKNNNIHLCWSCQNSYPECPAKVKDILLGDDVGNDNICCCNAYCPTESNASDEDEIRQKEEEYGEKAWQLFRNICELNGTECIEAFDTISCRTVLDEMTYSEAKARYEAWKKEKDEIRVGDEVEYKCDGIVRFVVFGIVGITAYGFKYPCDYDDVGEYCDIDMLTKTGRHFPEIAELLKKMREE